MTTQYEQLEPRSEKSEGKQLDQSGPPPMMSERGRQLAEKSAPRNAFDIRPSGGKA